MSQDFSAWIGRSETVEDTITTAPVAGLAATFDRACPDRELPSLWHWAYFTPKPPAHLIGPDGHPKRGDFLPPIALPRRMWAGGRTWFDAPLLIGDTVSRRSTIKRIDTKQGRSGTLIFVTLSHDISTPRGVAVREEHDLVFRDNPKPDDPPPTPGPAPTNPDFSREIAPDPVLLFRYSALTFNSHRIHYDLPYATGEEGYRGLVVHGPFTASLLLDLARRHCGENSLTALRFRATAPAFAGEALHLALRKTPDGLVLAAFADDGRQIMEATAKLQTSAIASPSLRPSSTN